MTTELQQSRYDSLLRKVGDLKGGGSKVSEVLSELFPVFDVENMPPELVRLSGARLCWGGGDITSLAGNVPTGILINPAGSGKLITVTTMHAGPDTDTRVVWGVTKVIRGTVITSQNFRDTRDGAPNKPTGQIAQIEDAAVAVSTNQTRVLSGTDLTVDDPGGVCVLAPGTSLEVGLTALISNLKFSFSWKERTAEPSELRE